MAKGFSIARRLLEFMNMDLGSLTANELIALESDLSVILHFGHLSLLGAIGEPVSFSKMKEAYNRHVTQKNKKNMTSEGLTKERHEAIFSMGLWFEKRSTEEFLDELEKIQSALKEHFRYIETVLTDEALNKTPVDRHRIPFRTVKMAYVQADMKLATSLDIFNAEYKEAAEEKQEEVKRKYPLEDDRSKNLENRAGEFNNWSSRYEMDSAYNAFFLNIGYSGDKDLIERLICLIFNASLHEIRLKAFKRCESCGNWFIHVTKKTKIYCSNRCATREGAKKRRKILEEKNPEELDRIRKEAAVRGRKNYEKKIQEKHRNAKPARRPYKYKDEEV